MWSWFLFFSPVWIALFFLLIGKRRHEIGTQVKKKMQVKKKKKNKKHMMYCNTSWERKKKGGQETARIIHHNEYCSCSLLRTSCSIVKVLHDFFNWLLNKLNRSGIHTMTFIGMRVRKRLPTKYMTKMTVAHVTQNFNRTTITGRFFFVGVIIKDSVVKLQERPWRGHNCLLLIRITYLPRE